MTFASFKNARIVKSGWLNEGGRRLDCNPYMSGALESRDLLRTLNAVKQPLSEVTERIFHAGREGRLWVDAPDFGVPFLGSSDIQNVDLSYLPLLSKKQIDRNPLFIIGEKWVLVTRSGTIGRMAYSRRDMQGLACSEHVLRVVPDAEKIEPGYLFAFLSSSFGVPLVVSGTYGAIIQHIEPEHIASVPIPRFSGDQERYIASLVDQASDDRASASAEIEDVKAELSERLNLREQDLQSYKAKKLGFSVSVNEVLSTGRLEATYHDAQVQEIEKRVTSLDHRKIADVAKVVKPGMFRRIKVDGPEWGYGFITGSELFSIAPKPIYFVSPKTPNISECVLEPNWVLIQGFGQIGGLIGRCIMTSGSMDNCAATDLQIQVRLDHPSDAAYLFAFLSTFAGYRLLVRTPIGGSIPHIHPHDVENLLIPWLEESERREFGDRILEAWSKRERAIHLEDKAREEVEKLIRGDA
ncbi:hypothetical protein BWQ95_08975 [Aeromonas hydrophila]|uniref:methylation-associated defense system restriction endonuclease subunit S MAD5 n=1 Tax=Gammaproteobacteria TaxID=1236 RepID=UPI00097D52A9|nr:MULTISPECIES: hypothetical protein [Gammaproteobacteria]ONG09544.1 hypothetical protein BWQ95_08975 [Aeromonas hydrophila]RDT34518.1 hypothetical protein DXF89_23065 [Enterobacter roggenkampii]HDT5863907.1 hypothetical protein [Aeromonas hydrophila subsp. hydrophila]HDT5895113.1 hypothetical protein [Aeromonas hydrophila subsp. hydrophila]